MSGFTVYTMRVKKIYASDTHFMSTVFDSVQNVKMSSFSALKRRLDLGFKLGPNCFQASALTKQHHTRREVLIAFSLSSSHYYVFFLLKKAAS